MQRNYESRIRDLEQKLAPETPPEVEYAWLIPGTDQRILTMRPGESEWDQQYLSRVEAE